MAHHDARTRRPTVRPTSSAQLQRRAARSAVGRRLHLSALLGGRWCSSASSSTSSRAASWAGSSPATCAPTSSSTRCAWRSPRRHAGADVELVHHSDAGSQYTSYAFTQVLDDHGVLASIGSVGDAYDNALAESFVDSFKTELIADRVWRTRNQLELAIVEYVAWFNTPASARGARRPSPSRGGGPLRCPDRSDSLSQSMKRGTHQTRSPRNPARLTGSSAGKNDTYGFALAAHPGKSQGRPVTPAGSQPIGTEGLPDRILPEPLSRNAGQPTTRPGRSQRLRRPFSCRYTNTRDVTPAAKLNGSLRVLPMCPWWGFGGSNAVNSAVLGAGLDGAGQTKRPKNAPSRAARGLIGRR